MSAYRRFLPRDGTRTTVHSCAEIAEAAEVEAIHGFQAAEAVLKPAELRPRTHQPQQTSAQVQQQQCAGIPDLQQVQQLQQAPGPWITEMQDLDSGLHTQPLHPGPRAGIPPEWSEGVARLRTMPAPSHYPPHAWQQLIIDAEKFLEGWAAQAARLGWPARELFGCHRRAPWRRIQGMGLVLLLRGDGIAALTATEALIRRRTGARQSYRCKPHDPLHPAERCLVWDLDGAL
jgi:hypothetical protein